MGSVGKQDLAEECLVVTSVSYYHNWAQMGCPLDSMDLLLSPGIRNPAASGSYTVPSRSHGVFTKQKGMGSLWSLLYKSHPCLYPRDLTTSQEFHFLTPCPQGWALQSVNGLRQPLCLGNKGPHLRTNCEGSATESARKKKKTDKNWTWKMAQSVKHSLGKCQDPCLTPKTYVKWNNNSKMSMVSCAHSPSAMEMHRWVPCLPVKCQARDATQKPTNKLGSIS